MISAVGAVAGEVLTRHLLSEVKISGWTRTNYSGQPVSLTGGVEAVAGLVFGNLLHARCAGTDAAGRARAMAAVVASLSAAAAGYVDDHLEDRFPARGKGYAGHLGALREGRLTSGVVKIGAVGAGSLVAGMLGRKRPAESLVDAALIALSANVANLLDLRPGRARKFLMAASLAPALAGSHTARICGAVATTGLREDLQGKKMLGDLGANALGAQLGVVLTELGLPVKLGLLALLAGLNAASEKVSFSAIIESTPGLRELDALGRS
ncbi:hypothetical protein INS90_05475 [Trueperella pecoris]|uniref:Uncharacterized protein n=1 Tax=Trueperella pecoris TaxID=2733571 RepID=A0A7M1QZZ9_9ACTO|nr:hypothetical protein [Trueperella pecoris]QOR46757.1 hypothetical protein INS90_05475 [Trueperella pecoris]